MRSFALAMLLLLSLVLVACTDDGDANGETPAVDDEPTATATVEGEAGEDPTATSEPPDETATPDVSPTPETEATEEPPTETADTTTPTVEPEETGTPTADVEVPDTPVGERLDWFLTEVNEGGEDFTAEAIEENFAPEVLEQVPADQLSQQLRDFADVVGPATLAGFLSPPTPTEAAAIVMTDEGEEVLLNVAVEENEPHLLIGLTFQPVPTAAEFESWDDFDEQFATLATETSFVAAEVTEESCETIHALNADSRLAVGSTFKLYVLGELASQIEAGNMSWDDELEIRDEWKSLPSGTMQNEPAGTSFTLREYAELMISISDNTATDHLIHHLGREDVQAMQDEMGHGAPDENLPFLTTMELFKLKLALPETQVEEYIAASPEEQREMLETVVADAEVSLDDAMEWTSPRYTDELEWFASTEDLCEAMAWLHNASEREGLEPVRDILSTNPGVPIDDDTWTWVGFKGGSEPGVLNLTWLLERDDGRLFAVSATLNDEEQPIDQPTAIEQLLGAMSLLAEEE